MAKFFFVLCALVSFSCPAAYGQAYPSKPVRFIVPFPPGGGSDLVARALAAELARGLGQQVVIDNRAGAQGGIGAMAAAKAAPDGYTIWQPLLAILCINPWIYKDVGYDSIRDFAHITHTASQPFLVVANPRVPAKSFKELAALAKARPGELTFATSSALAQLAGEMFNQLTGTKMIHVPYKGGGPAMLSVLGGEVDVSYASIPSAIQMVNAGKLRALAVTSAKRSPALPNIMSAKESGLPDMEVNSWYSVAAPANTPKEVITRLNAEIARALQSPALRQKLDAEGYELRSNTPEEMTNYVKAEYERWGKVVKAAGIKQE